MDKKEVLGSSRNQALKLLSVAGLLLFVVTVFLLMMHSINAAWSFCAGGLAILLPNAWQVISVFKEKVASAAKRTISRFYRTEILKFFMVAIVFIGLMKFTKLHVLAFILGVLVAQLGFWLLMPLVLSFKR